MKTLYYKVEVTRSNMRYPQRQEIQLFTIQLNELVDNAKECAKELAIREFITDTGIIGDKHEAEILEIIET